MMLRRTRLPAEVTSFILGGEKLMTALAIDPAWLA